MDSTDADAACGACGRELRGGVARCVVCGWSADARLRALDEAGRVRAETLRCYATVAPFLASGALLGLLAAAVADHATEWGGWTACAALVVLGPLVTALRLVGHACRWVRVEPGFGLALGARRVPWDEVAGVEREADGLAYHASLESLLGRLPMNAAVSRLAPYLLLPVLVHAVLVPVVVELSPWRARLALVLTSGERLVLRDLEESERFEQTVRHVCERRALRAA